ncbi:zinc finger protein 436-like [Cololabis saira]|uniref:zinc finger protein 436-like n=1 Tax=Cololabis saira TaxID=129043 RepID=UPI002AD30038|nr:zinc finger protein 436-like [Cololabis saira]
MSKVYHLTKFIGLLDLPWKPEIRLNRIDLPGENVCKVEEDGVFSDQHLDNLERSCSPDQEEPGNPQTTELEEDSSVQEMNQEDVEVDVSLVNLADEIFENGEPGLNCGQLLFHTSPESQNEEEGTESLRSDSSKTADLEPMRRHSDHEDAAVPSDSNCKSELTRTHTGKKAFSCSTCRKEFSRKGNLEDHMKIHTGERPYLCNTCGKSFTQSSALKRHELIHTGEKPYVCTTCVKSFRERSTLLVHSRTHTGERPYLCNTCGKTFTELTTLKRHITTHTGEKPYICKICGKGFREPSTRVAHSRTHTGERPYQCNTCNKNFTRLSALKLHITTHTGEKRYSCQTKVNHLREFIGQRLTAAAVEIFSVFEKTVLEYEEELDRQRRLLDLAWKPEIRLNRIDLPQENVCKVEEDGVFSDQHLDNLERSCSPDQEESGNPQTIKLEEDSSVQEMKQEDVEVDVSLVNLVDVKVENGEAGPNCDQLLLHSSLEAENKDEEGTESLRSDSSKTADLESMRRHGDHEDTAVPSDSNCKSKLTRHFMTYTEKKAFSCSICRKEFSKSSILVYHMRIHTGERQYLCNTCGKSFKQPSTLKKHKMIHTGEKPYVCTTCGKSYRHCSGLLVHSRTHTGERPYLCNTCGKTFTNLTDLNRHITTHTGEKPYLCKTCGKGYSHRSNLVIHSRTHTGERPYLCNTCGKTFTHLSNFKRHITMHTGEKVFVCKTCGKSYRQRSDLLVHSRTHSSARSYLCNICGKTFNKSSNLKSHITTHTGEKPYLCKTCNKGFTRRNNLLSHMKIHPEEKSGDS